jgi:hypothetical protein
VGVVAWGDGAADVPAGTSGGKTQIKREIFARRIRRSGLSQARSTSDWNGREHHVCIDGEEGYTMKDNTIFVAVGPQVWGKGFTKDQALAAMRSVAGERVKKYIVYETDDPWAFIDGMGRICYDRGCEYREVDRKGLKQDAA